MKHLKLFEEFHNSSVYERKNDPVVKTYGVYLFTIEGKDGDPDMKYVIENVDNYIGRGNTISNDMINNAYLKLRKAGGVELKDIKSGWLKELRDLEDNGELSRLSCICIAESLDSKDESILIKQIVIEALRGTTYVCLNTQNSRVSRDKDFQTLYELADEELDLGSLISSPRTSGLKNYRVDRRPSPLNGETSLVSGNLFDPEWIPSISKISSYIPIEDSEEEEEIMEIPKTLKLMRYGKPDGKQIGDDWWIYKRDAEEYLDPSQYDSSEIKDGMVKIIDPELEVTR